MSLNKSGPSASSSLRQPSEACIEFKLSEVHKATKKFDDSLVIGIGYYGTVYKGEVFVGSTNVPAAIKRVNPVFKQRVIQSRPEVEKLSSLCHPNIVSLLGYCHYVKEVRKPTVSGSEEEMVFVYEYIPNGTLKDHLHGLRTPLSFLQRLNICIGFASGLHHLHTNGVMHGDIKSANILLTEGLEAKISDYGLLNKGEILIPECNILLPYALGYWDPYSLCDGMLTRRSDVYSFGVVVLEVFCRKVAFDETRPIDDYHRNLVAWFKDSVKETKLEDIIDPDMRNEIITSLDCLKELFEIVERCLIKGPECRPKMNEVLGCLVKLQKRFNQLLEDSGNIKSVQGDQSLGSVVKEFTLHDLEKATEGFSPDMLLSQQSFGKLYLGYVEENMKAKLVPSKKGAGFAVAIKWTTSKVSQSSDEWLEDVKFLGQLEHPNIVRLVGFYYKDGPKPERVLVYEHMEKSLSQSIHGDKPIVYGARVLIMMEVARALIYLYTSKDILCHFGCEDILLDESSCGKIGGFAWTKIHERHDWRIFGYLKSESDNEIREDMKNDICSFGLVLLETMTGRHHNDLHDILVGLESLDMGSPKSKSNRRKLEKMIDPHMKDTYSPQGAFECMSLAKRCIATRPEHRPSRRDILSRLEHIFSLDF